MSLHTVPIAARPEADFWFKSRGFEVRLWILILGIVNLGLINQQPNLALHFSLEAVGRGEWWRILTWPFVHVSVYHLLLDGTAFLLLLDSLKQTPAWRRTFLVITACTGSLLVPLWLAPELGQVGLCGLSGPAHGLAAVWALEMIARRRSDSHGKRLGWLLLVGLFGKCAWELWQGQVVFADLHFGGIGHPVVSTHAGGLLGGLFGWLMLNIPTKDSGSPAGDNDNRGPES
ncbi:MAG: rhombosortase [Gammaproteobacteria bacterium]|nr:MAG: rhombosortase [Gammaproteobacteria bacterium]